MKTSKLFLLLTMMTFVNLLSSCNEEDVTPHERNQQLANEQNALEENPIAVTDLTNHVNIEGATKKSGTAPAPTGTVDFQIETNTQMAFQSVGFLIQFQSTSNVAGAYIQLRDVDGNKANGYFDVPTSAFSSGRWAQSNKNPFTNRVTNDLLGIAVSFNNALPPGQFCYDICIYDDQNNISQIQTICVEVEAWGGNVDVVGQWKFDRYEPNNDVFYPAIICDSVEVNEQLHLSPRSLEFDMRADGTYTLTIYEEYRKADFSTSLASCAAVYEDEVNIDHVKYLGQWAYNETNQHIVLVAFSFEDLIDPNNNQVSTDGSVQVDAKSAIIHDEWVLTFENAGSNTPELKFISKRI
ncbi:MAG: hypothetical protein ACPGJS_11010 [Flammeovirgaceae bacterium]